MDIPRTIRDERMRFSSSRRVLLGALGAALLAGCDPSRGSRGSPSPGPPPTPAPGPVARLRLWDSATLVRLERSGRAVGVSNGMGLLASDIVETAYTYAEIDFGGGPVWLDVYTRVRIGSLWLFFGRLFSSVSPPFAVETEDVTASPEGTAFGFRRNRASGEWAVAVESGRVRCSGRRVAFRYDVSAGQILVASSGKRPSAPRPGDIKAETSWVRGAMRRQKPPPQIR